MKMNIKKILIITLIISNLTIYSIISEEKKIKKLNKEVWITIFVHGIIKGPISFGDLYHIVKDKVENTKYAYTIQYIRNDSRFYRYQAMQKQGLNIINPIDDFPGFAAGAISKIYEYQLKKNGTINLYYTFGWPGLLSATHRKKQGEKFYNELEKEIKKFKDLNINPKIRIISFSHGGNVTLNIARSIADNSYIQIEELILIGMPVQRETDYLINHKLFKKIFNFYSNSDIAQTVDIFTTNYQSHRKFRERKNFKIPEKLSQIQIQVTKILQNDSKQIKQKYKYDPGHMELWFFGWIPKSYRYNFPLKPLPVISIVPTLIEHIQNLKFSNNLAIEINPTQEKIIIKDLNKKINISLPFYKEFFNDLASLAMDSNPYKFNLSKDRRKMIEQAVSFSFKERKKFKQSLY